VRDAARVAGTVVTGVGLALILWRELGGAAQRRRLGRVRDTVEVLLPAVAAVALLIWVWVG
jgi:hypothetical protein